MNASDAGVRIPRKLAVLAGAVVLGGIGAAGLYAAVGRAPESSRAEPSVEPRPATAAAAAPVKGKPRAGRALSLAEALKELDLIQPTRRKLAEDFALPTPGGQRFRLAEQRGKVLLVNFWATWCGPCREEMPAMERLWQRQKDQGFVLVAVSVDVDPKVVHPYLAKYKLTFPVALDPKLDVGNAYGVRALPSSFIVDREGYVAALALGPRPWDGDASLSLIEGLLR
jgi:peroxiredoxin